MEAFSVLILGSGALAIAVAIPLVCMKQQLLP